MMFGLADNVLPTVTSAIAFVLSLVFCIVVLRTSPGASTNRRLAFLLAADALFSLSNIWGEFSQSSTGRGVRVLIGSAVALEALAQLAFIATLDTPLARPFAGRRGTLTLAGLGLFTFALIMVGYVRGASVMGFGNLDGPGWFLLMFTSIVTLAASIDAYRRTERGTLAHRRSAAAMRAFVARDSLFVVLVILWPIGDIKGIPLLKSIAESTGGVALALFVVLLTYGILRTQLFDIDLKIRWGIQKGTIIGIIVAAAFVGEKLAENYLSREYGWVVGSVVAGLLVFAAPRLNKLGDKIASTALPQVQPTPAYLQFKKLEVYKAAVESAQETGGIDARQRRVLEKLRAKLVLSTSDCEAIEAETLEGAAAPSSVATGA